MALRNQVFKIVSIVSLGIYGNNFKNYHMQKIENKLIIAQFEPLLKSYAETLGIEKDSFKMTSIEDMLIEVLKKTVGENYSQDVLVAFAGVVGDMTFTSFVASFKQFDCLKTKGVLDRIITNTETEVIASSAKWLQGFSKFTYSEARVLLTKLLNKYFPVV